MFGHIYRCSKCPFSFNSGWSHHEGGQLLICKACGQDYVLGRGQSCWGTKEGERLQLMTRNEETRTPTGINTVVKVVQPEPGNKSDGVSVLQLDKIPCPKCKCENSLVQTLEQQSPCPICKTGVVTIELHFP
jgi:hypothetical protein